MCYRYINRGLYEKDKLTFVLLVTMKILITAALLKTTDLTIFLRGGAALDINSVGAACCPKTLLLVEHARPSPMMQHGTRSRRLFLKYCSPRSTVAHRTSRP